MENIDFFLKHYVNSQSELEKLVGSIQKAADLHAKLLDIAELRSATECMKNPTFEKMLPHFQKFFASDSIQKYFDQEAICSLNSAIYQPAGKVLNNEIMSGLQFMESPHFSVAAAVVDPTSLAFKRHRNRDKPTSIRMAAKDTLFRFIKAGDAVVTIYACDAVTDSTPATADMRCRLVRTFEVKDGDEIILRAGQDSISFESSKSSVCFVQAYLKHSSASVTPEFDTQSMKLIGLSAANDVSSRIQFMTTVLRLLKYGDAFDCCIPFTKHSDYFVRWYVMRELLCIDPERAWPMVVDMAEHDPSQDVRKTAARTLELFGSHSITG